MRRRSAWKSIMYDLRCGDAEKQGAHVLLLVMVAGVGGAVAA